MNKKGFRNMQKLLCEFCFPVSPEWKSSLLLKKDLYERPDTILGRSQTSEQTKGKVFFFTTTTDQK